MKRKVGGKVLLQGYDAGFILNEMNATPGVIFSEVFSKGRSCVMIVGRDNVNFCFEFKSKGAKKWILEQDWILDYDEYEKKTPDELDIQYKVLVDEYNSIVNEFNAKDLEERKKLAEETFDELQKLSHKMKSVDLMSAYLRNDHQWP